MKTLKIGIIGSGLIGRAWSMLFTSVGYQVMLYDILPAQIETALLEIEKELKVLEEKGILRGKFSAKEQFSCISATIDIMELVRNATFIQECIPESLELKQSLYTQLDGVVSEGTIISSSTSTFVPSLFSKDLKLRKNILVSHPLNPPYYIPLVEIVPSPWTTPVVISKTYKLMLEIGQKPVTLSREIQGFATNRIQYAIINEVWRLVADGIISVADVDKVMTNGLGLRYAFIGPLETAHLNANGVADYFARYGSEITAVSQTFGPAPQVKDSATLADISKQCEQLVPIPMLPVKRLQRDKFLRELNEVKKNFESDN